jgi:hypothetical protein
VEVFRDVPCGDFNWMKYVTLPHGTRYIGGDIVAPRVHDLQKKYANERYSFHKIDILEGPLPTTYSFSRKNDDVKAGGFRFINLRLLTFMLSPPLSMVPDFAAPEPPRYLGLWSRKQVAAALGSTGQINTSMPNRPI